MFSTFEEHARIHLRCVELLRLRTRISLTPEEDVLLYVTSVDVSHSEDDVGEFKFLESSHFVLSEESILLVLKPESVSISQPLKLFSDDLGEEWTWSTIRLQHTSNIQVNVHHVAMVGLLKLVEHVRVLLELVLVDLTELVDHGESKTLPDSVVVCQTIVSASHDVQSSEISSVTEKMKIFVI